MSVKVVNSGPGEIKITASTTPAISVTQPSVNVVNINPLITGIGTGPTGATGPQGPAGNDGVTVTYGISCETGTGSAEQKIRLTGSDSTTDDVILAVAGDLSIARTSADKITITNTISNPVLEADTSTAGFQFVVDEDNMSSNSATKLPTQQSVKAYVDSQVSPINTNITTDLTVSRDATSVTVISSDGTDAVLPQSSTSQAGVMSAASHTKLANLNALADATDSTNVAAAGAVMDSDFGSEGLMKRNASSGSYSVVANTDGIPEGSTNKYYTDAKVNTLLGNTNVSALANGSNVILTTTADVNSASFVVDEDNMASNLNTKVPTQQSVKAYVDSQLSSTSGLTDVHASATQDGELLVFSTSNNKYIPRLLTAGGNVTITNTQNGISIAANTTPRTVQVEVGGGATNTLADAETLKLTPGANIALTETGGTVSIATTDAVFTNVQAQQAVLPQISGGTGILVANPAPNTTATINLNANTSQLTDVNGSGSNNGELLIYNASTNKYDTNTLTAGSNVTITEGQGTIEIASANDNTQLSNEQVQDIVGDMFASNTETLITATYQDGDGTIDLAVDNDLANYSNSNSGFLNASSTTNSLNDVNGSGTTNGQILIYNQSSNKYQPGLINGGSNVTVTNTAGGISIASTASGGASALDDLSDVTIASAAANQYLVHNGGSTFVNQALDISHDTTPTLGGDLVVSGNKIKATGNGQHVDIEADTNNIRLNAAGEIELTPGSGNHINAKGALDMSGNAIVTTGNNNNITLDPHGTGNVILGNFVFDVDQTVGAGQDNYVLTYDHAGGSGSKISLEPASTASGTVDTNGTPADDQIAIFTDTDTIEGQSTLTFASNALTIKATSSQAGYGGRILFGVDNTDQYNGDIVNFGSGPGGTNGNIEKGKLYYLDSSQQWELADANTVATASGMLGIAVVDDSPKFLVRGFARHGSWAALGTGNPLFISAATTGEIVNSAPSGTGDVVRVIGYSTDSGSREIFFNPSNDWIELV